MKPHVAKFQIGKSGLTQAFLESLTLAFKHRKQVRVSVLQNKTETKAFAEEIAKKLPVKVNYKILGFTIILTKQ